MEFTIPAMSCGHCVRAITDTVLSTDPAAHVTIDLPSKHLTVQSTQPPDVVATALKAAGYPVA